MGGRRAAIFIGNSIFGDDRIGLVVGDLLRGRLEENGFDVHIMERTGFALLDSLEGYDSAVVVDSICTESTVGEVFPLSVEDFWSVKPNTPHFSGVPEAVNLMRGLRMDLPELYILGINVKNPYTLSESISYDLDRRKEAISAEVFADILALAGRSG